MPPLRSGALLPAAPVYRRSPWPPAAPQLHPLAGLRHLARATLRQVSSWRRSGAVPAASHPKALLAKLELALKARRIDDAWASFDALKDCGGGRLLPTRALVGGLIAASSYSSDRRRLCRAHDLALGLSRKRSDLLRNDSLSSLALALARAQMPEPAARVLRVMLRSGKLPPTSVWGSTIFHLARTPVGSHLAAGVLIDLSEYFLQCPPNSKSSKLTKPGTTLFNLVLDSCVRYASTLHAQKVIDVMIRTGVVADVGSIVTIARVYESNGNRGDLTKLKPLADSVSSGVLDRHYQQFYDCLFSLHFKFNDIDAAAGLVLDLHRRPMFLGGQAMLGRPRTVQVGSGNLKTGSKMLIDPMLLDCSFAIEPECHFGLVVYMNDRILPTHKAIAKLVKGYIRSRRVGELSKLLGDIYNIERPSPEANLGSDIIVACVELGWLETAHDIIDDMESAGASILDVAYAVLLTAYCKQNMLPEAKVLLGQMRKGHMLANLPDEKVISLCLSDEVTANHIYSKSENSVSSSNLAEFLDIEAREDDQSGVHLTHEFNLSIFFFCRAKMMEDAIKTYRRMHERKIQPTVQTFSHLLNGYSSLEMYREITILWGEIRRRLEAGALPADRDLLECLVVNMIRGGYFERTMEIIDYMMKYSMYTDKWKIKSEFLKLHKNLYRNLNASTAMTDAQSERLGHVKAFRKWVGIDRVKGTN